MLVVDLSKRSFSTVALKEGTACNFIGGTGLGIKILIDHCPAGVDPLSPANPLVLTTGPTGGTMTPTGGNGHVFLAKSPETGMLGQALSHGSFGCELKRTGYDVVMIKGKADKPVYLFIDDSERRLVECAHLLGKPTYEVDYCIKKEIGDFGVRVASIGVGGDNIVKYACIMNECYRAAGRTGMGAVMGSKNLKAIAVRGTNAVEVGNPQEFKNLVTAHTDHMIMLPVAIGPFIFSLVFSELGTNDEFAFEEQFQRVVYGSSTDPCSGLF